jgi:hypothetical protein
MPTTYRREGVVAGDDCALLGSVTVRRTVLPWAMRGDDMLKSSDVVAFAAATDLRRAREFYEQKLGLPVVSQDDFAWFYDPDGNTLSLTQFP